MATNAWNSTSLVYPVWCAQPIILDIIKSRDGHADVQQGLMDRGRGVDVQRAGFCHSGNRGSGFRRRHERRRTTRPRRRWRKNLRRGRTTDEQLRSVWPGSGWNPDQHIRNRRAAHARHLQERHANRVRQSGSSGHANTDPRPVRHSAQHVINAVSGSSPASPAAVPHHSRTPNGWQVRRRSVGWRIGVLHRLAAGQIQCGWLRRRLLQWRSVRSVRAADRL